MFQLLARLGKKTDISNLDLVLFPHGLKQQAVCEFYGKDGTGKSQTLLHLIANCILPHDWKGFEIGGFAVGVILVDTDYHFSMIRLAGILEYRINTTVERVKNLHSNADDVNAPSAEEVEQVIKDSLKLLHVVKCNNSNQLIITLHSLQSLIASKPEICVLMIDSASAFHWIDRNQCLDSSAAYDNHISKITEAISSLVVTYKLVAFVTKLALFEKKQKGAAGGLHYGDETKWELEHTTSDNKKVQHCEYLGSSWSKLVTHRLIFESVQSDKSREPKLMVSCDKGNDVESSKQPLCVKFGIMEGGLQFLTS